MFLGVLRGVSFGGDLRDPERLVRGEGVDHSPFLHHVERNAVGKAPLLVGASGVEVGAGSAQRGREFPFDGPMEKAHPTLLL